jgi:hypothetical protein
MKAYPGGGEVCVPMEGRGASFCMSAVAVILTFLSL